MIKFFILAGACLAGSLSALAQDPAPTGADVAPPAIADRFKTLYPNTRFTEVRRARITGLYEVVMGETVAYTDESGRYFIFGHLFDMREQVDLTAQRRTEGRKVSFPTAFLKNAIKTVKGDGRRVVAIFSDPDCPYCNKLEAELSKVDNVTIYTFLYPLEQLHPAAKARSVAIWCAPDRAMAWRRAVLEGAGPRLVACVNPIEDNLALGSRLGVMGTPTLVSADGRLLPGAVSAEKLEQWLNPPAALPVSAGGAP